MHKSMVVVAASEISSDLDTAFAWLAQQLYYNFMFIFHYIVYHVFFFQMIILWVNLLHAETVTWKM